MFKLLSYYISEKYEAFRNSFDNNLEGRRAQTVDDDAQAKHWEMLVKYLKASDCLLSPPHCSGVMLIN